MPDSRSIIATFPRLSDGPGDEEYPLRADRCNKGVCLHVAGQDRKNQNDVIAAARKRQPVFDFGWRPEY